MLGRLVVPADRLADAEAAASRAGASVDEPWRVSALVGTAAQCEAIAVTMIADHRRPRSVRVEAVEAVAGSADDIARLAHVWPSEFERYVEIPAHPDPAPLMAALSAAGLFAKIRAGGLTPDNFPSSGQLARFLIRARDAGVPMKATAGLHHALRGDYRLTYEAESANATMHGFVNLVLAATLLAAGKIDEPLAEACLDDSPPRGVQAVGPCRRLAQRRGHLQRALTCATEPAAARRDCVRLTSRSPRLTRLTSASEASTGCRSSTTETRRRTKTI